MKSKRLLLGVLAAGLMMASSAMTEATEPYPCVSGSECGGAVGVTDNCANIVVTGVGTTEFWCGGDSFFACASDADCEPFATAYGQAYCCTAFDAGGGFMVPVCAPNAFTVDAALDGGLLTDCELPADNPTLADCGGVVAGLSWTNEARAMGLNTASNAICTNLATVTTGADCEGLCNALIQLATKNASDGQEMVDYCDAILAPGGACDL